MWGLKMLSTVQLKSSLEAALQYSKDLNSETIKFLEDRGISEDIARRYHLGTIVEPVAGHENYKGWLSIPYLTAMGHCVGFKFRRLDDGKPKYGAPLGQKGHLYNVSDIIISSEYIAICEGELDTIVSSAILGLPAVGVPGVAAWKPHFTRMFSGYGRIFIIGDNDLKDDGTNPGAEFSRMVAQEVDNATIVSLPAGMDLNDLYLAKGIEETKRTIGVPNV
jgi:DNA primase